MKDEVFGNINYRNGAWVREETVEVYGTSRDVVIEIRADKNSSLNIQKKAYGTYLSEIDTYLNQMPRIVLNEYLYNYKDIESRVKFSENSPLLRENISESIIVKTFAPVVVLFDEKGNYGWICKCGWTEDRTIAILLSEDTPRVLTPSQLRDYRKIDDPVFGVMIYDDDFWEKYETKNIYGKVKYVNVATDDCDGGISEVERKSYERYKESENHYFDIIPETLLSYYLSTYENVKEMWRVPRQYNKKNISKDNVMDLIDFKELYIDEDGRCAWLCECPWEEDDGIAFVLSDGKVRVELQTDIL